PDGSRSVIVTDDSGEPQWRPLVPRLRVGPDGAQPRLASPLDDPPVLAGVARTETDVYVLDGPWVVEICWAGLWVHHADRPRLPPTLADTDWDAQWLIVVVDGDVPEHVLASLAEHLPRDARSRMRVHRPGMDAATVLRQ